VHFLLRCDKIVNILHKAAGRRLAKLKAGAGFALSKSALDRQTFE
jgi:hypothetical protein